MPSSLILILSFCILFTYVYYINYKALPVVLSGHDLIGIAQTGSGKTHTMIGAHGASIVCFDCFAFSVQI